MLKINARQQLNKKLKKRKQPNNHSNNGSTDIEAGSTASEILIQRNMSHLLTSFLAPKIEGIKRLASVGDWLIVRGRLMGRIVRLEKTETTGVVQLEAAKDQQVSDLISESLETGIENAIVVNLSMFEWDPARKFWRPVGSTGDM